MSSAPVSRRGLATRERHRETTPAQNDECVLGRCRPRLAAPPDGFGHRGDVGQLAFDDAIGLIDGLAAKQSGSMEVGEVVTDLVDDISGQRVVVAPRKLCSDFSRPVTHDAIPPPWSAR